VRWLITGEHLSGVSANPPGKKSTALLIGATVAIKGQPFTVVRIALLDSLATLWPIILAVVGAAVGSPLLVFNAFRVVRSDRPRYKRSLYRGVLLLLTISLLISMVSCFWTCGGHPTWTNGYK